MTNYPWESLDQIRDADARNRIELMYEEGRADDFDDVKELVRYRCRDNARTPMQWSAEENAGFTDGEPWLPVNPNHEEINVAAERADEESVWHYYRDLIALRDEHDILPYGSYDLLLPDHEDLWVYTRALGDERLLVTLNLSDTSTDLSVPRHVDVDLGVAATVLVANYADVASGTTADLADADLTLRPWEARVYHWPT
jgi:glycosidase